MRLLHPVRIERSRPCCVTDSTFTSRIRARKCRQKATGSILPRNPFSRHHPIVIFWEPIFDSATSRKQPCGERSNAFGGPRGEAAPEGGGNAEGGRARMQGGEEAAVGEKARVGEGVLGGAPTALEV